MGQRRGREGNNPQLEGNSENKQKVASIIDLCVLGKTAILPTRKRKGRGEERTLDTLDMGIKGNIPTRIGV